VPRFARTPRVASTLRFDGIEVLARALGGSGLAHFKPVATIDRLDVENLTPGDTENTFHRRRNVFVHPVRKLDYDDRAFTGRSDEPATD
jgi:hypothetical protein